jgi:hypothetical protein
MTSSTSQYPAASASVEGALDKLRAYLKQFFTENQGLSIFTAPSFADGVVQKHIMNLQLPKVSSTSMYPSLLLHGLQESSWNQHCAKLIDQAFHFGLPGFHFLTF